MNNTPTETTAIQAVSNNAALAEPMRAQASSLMLDVTTMESLMRVANLMASGKCTIPKHLQDSPADCMAVVMQSMQWGMNPFAVAQKTHISPSGALGYEAQLISAVVCANAPVKESAPEYEYIGDWSKVLGKVEERKSDKGGKYYVATYNRADETGLGVICRMTLRGESKPREITVMLTQCYPRFSTQWATDPKQQISYVAIRKWSRLFSPGTILGVYAPEELAEEQPNRDMGKAEMVQAEIPQQLFDDAEAAAKAGVTSYQKFWGATGAANRKLLASQHDHLKATAVDADKARTVETPQQSTNAATGEMTVTFEQVIAKLDKANTEDALYIAMDWSNAMEDQRRMGEVEEHFNKRLSAIKGE